MARVQQLIELGAKPVRDDLDVDLLLEDYVNVWNQLVSNLVC